MHSIWGSLLREMVHMSWCLAWWCSKAWHLFLRMFLSPLPEHPAWRTNTRHVRLKEPATLLLPWHASPSPGPSFSTEKEPPLIPKAAVCLYSNRVHHREQISLSPSITFLHASCWLLAPKGQLITSMGQHAPPTSHWKPATYLFWTCRFLVPKDTNFGSKCLPAHVWISVSPWLGGWDRDAHYFIALEPRSQKSKCWQMWLLLETTSVREEFLPGLSS